MNGKGMIHFPRWWQSPDCPTQLPAVSRLLWLKKLACLMPSAGAKDKNIGIYPGQQKKGIRANTF